MPGGTSKWRRAGSLFVAGPEEVRVNGEWRVPDPEDSLLPELAEPDKKRGIFGRMWGAITGR